MGFSNHSMEIGPLDLMEIGQISGTVPSSLSWQEKSPTLWQTNSLLLKIAIEIVDLPIKNCDFPWLC